MPDKSPALDAMFWREEILQVLFWLEGEQLVDAARAAELTRFLQGSEETIQHHLDRCCSEGYLEVDESGDGFWLTERGRSEGGRLFSDAFAGMQKQGHGECSADCICFTEGHEHCPVHAHSPVE